MRVAHIITRMIVGGAQENTLLNCLDLAEEFDDDVLLLTGPSVGPEGDLLERSGLRAGQAYRRGRAGRLEIQTVPDLVRNISPVRDWKASRALRSVLKAYKPDVVHTHSAKGGMLGRKVAWSLGKPRVVHTVHGAPFHEFQPRWAHEFFRRCERYAAKRCHHLISVADAMTDLMVRAKVAPYEKFTTIYSGMDVEPFRKATENREAVRAELEISADRVVVGKVARLFHLKGHDDLITAAAEVIHRDPRVLFLLVGDGVLRDSLEQRMKDLGVRDHFRFTGLVPPTDVPKWIGAMDVLVHTSLREGLARALPQSLIAGIPAVSFDIDGAKEVVIDGETGYLIPPRDTEQLAEAMVRLCENRELRQRLGGEGQRRFTDQFRHQTMTKEIRQLYARLCESKR
ncbi:MAG: glycosyltransferase family 4 protein [Planctomycetota bacterium]